jgi:chromosome segregation ATPase
MLLEKPQ